VIVFSNCPGFFFTFLFLLQGYLTGFRHPRKKRLLFQSSRPPARMKSPPSLSLQSRRIRMHSITRQLTSRKCISKRRSIFVSGVSESRFFFRLDVCRQQTVWVADDPTGLGRAEVEAYVYFLFPFAKSGLTVRTCAVVQFQGRWCGFFHGGRDYERKGKH
jgi:hypothetical protein